MRYAMLSQLLTLPPTTMHTIHNASARDTCIEHKANNGSSMGLFQKTRASYVYCFLYSCWIRACLFPFGLHLLYHHSLSNWFGTCYSMILSLIRFIAWFAYRPWNCDHSPFMNTVFSASRTTESFTSPGPSNSCLHSSPLAASTTRSLPSYSGLVV